jgi:hypothetical protein
VIYHQWYAVFIKACCHQLLVCFGKYHLCTHKYFFLAVTERERGSERLGAAVFSYGTGAAHLETSIIILHDDFTSCGSTVAYPSFLVRS